MVKGKIFDIKNFAVHDGPGIRTTVFFKGCPLNCHWCHNPEGIDSSEDLFYYDSKCIGCWNCIDVCPLDAISKEGTKIKIDRALCDVCGECVKGCPTTALQIAGKEVTVEHVMEEIRKSTIYHDTSQGGVTLSGGEPFQQFDFMRRLIERCKEEDIHVTVDTSGFVDKEKLNSIKDKVDLFLFDLKIMDDEKHREYTGVSNRPILENLKNLLEDDRSEVIIRFPLIPDITDTEENIDSILEFLSDFKSSKEIDILPYHDVVEKYNRLRREYKIEDVSMPERARVNKVKKRFEDEGYTVKEGG